MLNVCVNRHPYSNLCRTVLYSVGTVCMCLGWSSVRTTCLPANRQTDATMKIPTIRGSSPVTLLFWTLVLSSPRRQTALASQSIRTGVVVVRWVVSKAVCSSNESTESSWKSTCIYESVSLKSRECSILPEYGCVGGLPEGSLFKSVNVVDRFMSKKKFLCS